MKTQPPPNRQMRRRQQTRSKLVQATLDLALEKGYDAITVQDITERADLGRGTFYIYFKDKEDVLWSLIKAGLDATDQAAHRQVSAGLPARPEYFAYRNIFVHAAQNRDLYRLMLGGQGSAALTARVQDYLAADFTREMRQFQLHPAGDVPLEMRAQILVGAIIRLVIWWLETPNDYTADQMAEMLDHTLQPAYLPPV